jgi:D-glycero-D-manno-heptose 1,7-bisphosphate phosphatase
VSEGWSVAAEGGPLSLMGREWRDHGDRPRTAVFLDRDGVINELVPDAHSGHGESPLCVDDVRLLPGASAAVAMLARVGLALVCVSNQPAAAKGTASLEQLLAVHERVLELLAQAGIELDASYLCPHHPDGVIAGLAGSCECRKPRAGMLRAASSLLGLDLGGSWMVGDTDADIAAGATAGCHTLLIRNPGSVHKRLQALTPELSADSLAQGVELLQVN